MHDLECSSSSCRFLEQKEKKEKKWGRNRWRSDKNFFQDSRLYDEIAGRVKSSCTRNPILRVLSSEYDRFVLFLLSSFPLLFAVFLNQLCKSTQGGSFACNVFTSIRSVCTLNWNGVVILSPI